MRNRLRHVRLKKGLTQGQLAVACKTSQQQIQRIEAGAQSVKLDLAMRIASTLDTTVTTLFPETATIFKKLENRNSTQDEQFSLADDQEAVREMDHAGLDVNPARWSFKFRLRNNTEAIRPISSADNNRLTHNLQSGTSFFVFSSRDRQVVLNLKHLVFAHQLFDAPDSNEKEPASLQSVLVHLAQDVVPLDFQVESDVGDPDDPEGALEGQFRGLLFDFECDRYEDDDFFRFVDVDGEWAWFRAADVAMMEIPLWVLDSRSQENDEDLEDASEDEAPE